MNIKADTSDSSVSKTTSSPSSIKPESAKRLPFWKDKDGRVFVKENGQFVEFQGNVEELLGVVEC